MKQVLDEKKFEAEMANIGMASLSVIHEIKNPVTLIHGYAEMLREGNLPAEKVAKLGEKIEKSALKILDIIASVRALIKNEHSTNEQIKISEIIAEVSGQLHSKIIAEKIKLTTENDLNISGNKTQIYQVFYNLINNAIDAIAPLSEKWIKISCQQNGPKDLAIYIIDSGKIDPSIIDKIFLPLFSTKLSSGKGTGIGLYLVKRIVESHGGTVGVDKSAANTTFVIRLISDQDGRL